MVQVELVIVILLESVEQATCADVEAALRPGITLDLQLAQSAFLSAILAVRTKTD
jgi:hypothetical protein